MPIFTQGNNNCYYIHIPRTGGRYISSLFENSINVECKHHKINTERIDNIDVTHLHYPLYENYLGVKDIPHITVVRNPYDKFASCIKNMYYLHKVDYNNVLCNEEEFLKFVSNEIIRSSFHNNWFLPQYKFLSPKTHIWKYEWGFGKRFRKWVYNKTQIELDDKKVTYKKFDGETTQEYKLDNRIRKYVKNFYKEDYRKLGYFL